MKTKTKRILIVIYTAEKKSFIFEELTLPTKTNSFLRETTKSEMSSGCLLVKLAISIREDFIHLSLTDIFTKPI